MICNFIHKTVYIISETHVRITDFKTDKLLSVFDSTLAAYYRGKLIIE